MLTISSLDGSLFKKIICGGLSMLKLRSAEINNLNVFPVPDGDTGDNMFLTLSSGVKAINALEDEDASLGDVSAVLSRGMLLGARGNSGVILSQFFSGIAKQLEGLDEADATVLAEALSSGVKQAYISVMSPTEGTILTVAREGVGNAIIKLGHTGTVDILLSDVREEMHIALMNTPNLLPILKEAGVVDSGGAGLYAIFDGMVRAAYGDSTDVQTDDTVPETKEKNRGTADPFAAFGEDSVMTYGYCTEFLLRLQSSKVDLGSFDHSVITDYLSTVGNSIVAVRDGSIVKIHVHTLEPEKVLGFCRRYGEFLTMKIENMTLEHSEKHGKESTEQPKKAAPKKEYGTVAVCSGDGIKETFTELGIDCIIEGGQTNNPSTEDFLSAFDKVNAKHILVFPNNANVIMAAKQAANLYNGAHVHVIESRDLGSGYVGIASFNPEADSADELCDMINGAMENVVTGFVTTAVRSTEIGGVKIENGDNISFIGKKMIASEKRRADALHALIDSIFDAGEKFMLTAFCGRDVPTPERDELRAYMKKQYPDVELYIVDGGQEVYSHILIAE